MELRRIVRLALTVSPQPRSGSRLTIRFISLLCLLVTCAMTTRAEEDHSLSEPAEDRPSLSWAHYQLGMVYERADKLDSARVHYESALALDPDHKEAKKALKNLK